MPTLEEVKNYIAENHLEMEVESIEKFYGNVIRKTDGRDWERIVRLFSKEGVRRE